MYVESRVNKANESSSRLLIDVFGVLCVYYSTIISVHYMDTRASGTIKVGRCWCYEWQKRRCWRRSEPLSNWEGRGEVALLRVQGARTVTVYSMASVTTSTKTALGAELISALVSV